jgi:hypothetical protein
MLGLANTHAAVDIVDGAAGIVDQFDLGVDPSGIRWKRT